MASWSTTIPFNQRLEVSCAQFRRDLLAFRKEAGENRPWAILAHSMGALVARSYVEREGKTDHDVASLILIAPVNQGATSPGFSRFTRRSRA